MTLFPSLNINCSVPASRWAGGEAEPQQARGPEADQVGCWWPDEKLLLNWDFYETCFERLRWGVVVYCCVSGRGWKGWRCVRCGKMGSRRWWAATGGTEAEGRGKCVKERGKEKGRNIIPILSSEQHVTPSFGCLILMKLRELTSAFSFLFSRKGTRK